MSAHSDVHGEVLRTGTVVIPCIAVQGWPTDLLGPTLREGATVVTDGSIRHAMHWASLQEFYRVRYRWQLFIPVLTVKWFRRSLMIPRGNKPLQSMY